MSFFSRKKPEAKKPEPKKPAVKVDPKKAAEASRLYQAAMKLMNGEKVKCRRCLTPLRFTEVGEFKEGFGIVCGTPGCTKFLLDIKARPLKRFAPSQPVARRPAAPAAPAKKR